MKRALENKRKLLLEASDSVINVVSVSYEQEIFIYLVGIMDEPKLFSNDMFISLLLGACLFS